MRVFDAGLGAGFAVEALALAGVEGLNEAVAQELDGDAALEARVARFVDPAHAAGPKEGHDLVALPGLQRKLFARGCMRRLRLGSGRQR